MEVSYLEIYNEQVFDLLAVPGKAGRKKLVIRESKALGIYVDGLQVSSCGAQCGRRR